MRLCAWRCHALADAAYLCVCSAGPPRERQRRTTDPDSSRDSSRRAFGRTSGARPQRMRSHIVPPRPPVLRPILPRRALPISALGLRTPRLDLRPPSRFRRGTVRRQPGGLRKQPAPVPFRISSDSVIPFLPASRPISSPRLVAPPGGSRRRPSLLLSPQARPRCHD